MDVTKLDVYREAPLNARGKRVFRRTLRVGMRKMKLEIFQVLKPFDGKKLDELEVRDVRDALLKHFEEKYSFKQPVFARDPLDMNKLKLNM